MTDVKPSRVYRILIKEKVDSTWANWLGDFQVVHTPEGETLLYAPVIDQAALHGLLDRIRDMNFTLVSVNAIEAGETSELSMGNGE